jgi:hypothetical protein
MTWSEFERRIRVVHQAAERVPELVSIMPRWFSQALAIEPDEMAEARRRYLAAARRRRPDLAVSSEEDIIVVPLWNCDDCRDDEVWDFTGGGVIRCSWCGLIGLGCDDFECFEE